MSYLDWLKSDAFAEAQDSISSAVSMVWEIVGDDWYTCVPPPGYEPLQPAVEAVQTFDPGAIPIWRVQLWRAPGRRDLIPFVHAGIARSLPIALGYRKHLQVQMPAEAGHPAPNVLAMFFEGRPIGPNGPGEYIPWDWEAYEWCRRDFDRLTVAEFDRRIEARKAREAEAKAKHQEELEYRKAQIEPWILRKMEADIGDPDWKQYQHLLAAGARRVKGRKPFVQLPGVALPGKSTAGSHPAKE
jgi:hypothetical protein